MSGDMMGFPDNWWTFVQQYQFADKEETYTNGSMLIPSFRVRQMVEHYFDGGECECVWNEQEGTFHCSSCDTLLTYEVSIGWPSYKVMPITLPNYCPKCGKAVKR